jgi:Zn-finger nucleic acid-binding protein
MPMLRDDIATCPACGQGLDASGRRLQCGRCQGVLVTEDELREMISEMTKRPGATAEPRPLALEPPDWVEAPRTCPRCTTQMTKHRLYGMVVDRCEAHGIWFDAEELQGALKNVGEDATKMPLRDRVALTAAGVGWIAFLIASALIGPGR